MSLRRFLIGAIVSTLMLPAVSSAATRPHTTTTRYSVDRLEAMWAVKDDNSNDILGISVIVTRRTNIDTGEVTVSGVAGKGECSDTSGCAVFFKHGWKVTKFETDPAFAAASVVLQRRGERASVTWTTGTPFVTTPPIDRNPAWCKGGTVTTVYAIEKNASAEGRVLGHNVSTASENDAGDQSSEHMIQTIEVEDCP